VIDRTGDVIERVHYDAYGRAVHQHATDVDGDRRVNSNDASLIQTIINSGYNTIEDVSADPDAYRAEADLDRDGDVDLDDYGLIGQKKSALPVGELSSSAVDNNIGWDGYVFNAETRMYKVRMREYHPILGRWLERDPLGTQPSAPRSQGIPGGFAPHTQYVDGMNLYGFVRSNPFKNSDWDGQKVCTPATGSLRLLMKKYAKKFSPFTRSGNPDPDKRITWKVLSCLACIESSYKPCAKGKTGDFGLMQLTKTGALGQCVKDGILKKIDESEFTDERRKQCCGINEQPRFTKDDEGKIKRSKDCATGCDESIWNVENQIKCAAHYLRWLRDKQRGKWTLEMMLCQYNKGTGAEHCKTHKTAKDDPYVKEVMECLQNLDSAKPSPGVVSPPKEWE